MTEHSPVRVLQAEDNPGDARLVEILLSEIGFVMSHTDTLGGALEELVPSMAWNAVRFDLAFPDTYKASSSRWTLADRTKAAVRAIELGLITSGLENPWGGLAPRVGDQGPAIMLARGET